LKTSTSMLRKENWSVKVGEHCFVESKNKLLCFTKWCTQQSSTRSSQRF